MFDKKEAIQYVTALCKKHRIKVVKWSSTSCGQANKKAREIKIPSPTNVDRFAVCLHEIFHIIGRKGSSSFEKEFYCDKYALDTLVELGYATDGWIKRMKWHVLRCLAMAHNRGLNHDKINQEIRDFFSEIDFSTWKGKKVFAGYKYSQNPIPENIEIAQAFTTKEVEEMLKLKGLVLDKSQRDDATYNRWIVHDGSQFGSDYGNLTEIITHYQLAI